MNLPKPEERVFITESFVGIFSMQVCVVPDATDEEILQKCNEYEHAVLPTTSHHWRKVIRTQEDVDEEFLVPIGKDDDILPGPCKDCPPRIHMIVR